MKNSKKHQVLYFSHRSMPIILSNIAVWESSAQHIKEFL